MKRFILASIMLCFSFACYPQATDIVIDCQTPGWLSSMINYGDQQTVKNLKVTGYINNNDLDFIGSLASLYQLNGILDLGEVSIVGDSPTENNCFDGTKILFENDPKLFTILEGEEKAKVISERERYVAESQERKNIERNTGK